RLAQSAPATDAVRTGTPVLLRTHADCQQRYPQTATWMTAAGASSVGDWPLTAGAHPTGVLELMWTRPQPLDAAQQAYVSAVANMIAQALPRARRYADEHARAAALQAAVLPTHLAEVAGLEIAVCYEPADAAHGLGGDWYDAMALPKNQTYLAVGDVVGHGLPAVEDMAQLRSAGRALAVQGSPPARLLAELNMLTRHASQGKYATMAVAVFDHTAGSLSHGSAGHPPALLRRCGGDTVIRLDGCNGVVLGVLSEASYAQSQVVIAPGDILVMYTDGLVERRGQDIETGMMQVQRHVAEWENDASLHDACRNLIAALAPPPRRDDVCILGVRFR
ncbi:MAG: SpoIIE family protein phosphatase, partial [Mycobacterium sp.]|nr:SpoIIE family protein phosphatase [Mycobacterium sp.]